ncbi:MAG: MazG family protein, partial [Chloroflexi bacterium]|nr:MazG family protein [Chloroflexota bacterium]
MEQDPGSFDTLEKIVAKLRAPDGCPWDRAQTHASIKPYLIEEAYEVLQSLDDENTEKLCEELGDLLLQIMLHAQMANEAGEFNIKDVIRGISTKLIRRHPHVFGKSRAANA